MRRMNLVLTLAFLAFISFSATLFFRLAEPVAPHEEHDPTAAAAADAVAGAGVPQTLDNLHLMSLDDGPEALAAIDRLHGKALGLTDGYQAQYGQGPNTVTIWVARMANGDEARRLTDDMTASINEGRSPFSRPEPQQYGSLTLYKTLGMNQLHYYYANGSRIIWAALPRDSSPALLDQVVQAF